MTDFNWTSHLNGINVALLYNKTWAAPEGWQGDSCPLCPCPPVALRRKFGFAQVPSGLLNINKIIKYK